MNNKKQEGFLEKLRNERNVILYGCGSMSHRVLDILLNNGIVPSAVVDNNPALNGTLYIHQGFTRQIMGYNDVTKAYDDYVLILTVSIKNAIEIKKQLLNLGEQHLVYHMQCPFKVDNALYIPRDNEQEIQDNFEDDLSKKIYKEFINYKSTGNMFQMLQFVDGESYFDEHILDNGVKHCFVDCGCYTGDTISQFLLFCRNGYEKIVGMEIDPGNAKRAEQFAKYSRLQNVHILNMGGWSEKKQMILHTLKNDNAVGFDSPNLFVDASNIMDSKVADAKEKELYVDVLVPCDTIDHLFYDMKPSLLKINALAADLPILYGAERTCKKYAPSIVMDYGVRPEYIHETILFLKQCRDDYRFFLREKEIYGDYKTILYAIR